MQRKPDKPKKSYKRKENTSTSNSDSFTPKGQRDKKDFKSFGPKKDFKRPLKERDGKNEKSSTDFKNNEKGASPGFKKFSSSKPAGKRPFARPEDSKAKPFKFSPENEFKRDSNKEQSFRSKKYESQKSDKPVFKRFEGNEERINKENKAPKPGFKSFPKKSKEDPRASRDRNSLGKKDFSKSPKKITEKSEPEEEIRLNRYIANAGLCSRREADELISSGMIQVNGEVVTELGYKVKVSDSVKYGKQLLSREKLVYVLLNKPKDYITTLDDPDERKTVMELVKAACKERIYPVGRLDRNTTGLLLFTNDGELTAKLTHPSNNIKKIYQVEIDKPISTEDFEQLKKGVELEDGFIQPDEVGIVTPDAQVVGIQIHSGKNRIVRRIFEHLGYEVTKLDRTTFADLSKKDLPRGKWRFLSEKEIIRLKYMI